MTGGKDVGNNEKFHNTTDSLKKGTDKLNFDATPSPFDHAVAKLFVWYDGVADSKGWRVRKEYRNLFACLTPRQIKAFLRERLLASHEAGQDDPLVSMLCTLFHPIWKVWRDEGSLFQSLAITARAAIQLSGTGVCSDDRVGKLSGPAAEFFHRELLAAVRKSSVLSEDDVRACWPRKNEERTLLVHLLALIVCKEFRGITPGHDLPPSRGGLAIVPGSSLPPDDLPFAEWVYRKLGSKPVGLGVAEQVSSFQDMALAMYRNGDKSALQAVKEYADRFLEWHRQDFGASTASSLSNLAVLINDEEGSETQCDRLFQAAAKLAKPGSRIPFFYVEFLLNAMEDPARRERLSPDDTTGNSIVERARAILATVKDEDLELKDRLYRDILNSRIDASQTEDKSKRMAVVWKLAKQHRAALLGTGRESSSRLNNLLDSVIGKGGTSLRMKEPLQGMIWAAQAKSNNPGWPMATQIANDLVGESDGNSEEEKIGIRISAALVADEELLAAGESNRLAAIWSQTGALLAQRFGKAAQSRIALAFLACLAYGGSAQSFDRMRKTFHVLGGGIGGQSSIEWEQLLDDTDKPLAMVIERSTQDIAVMTNVRDRVFGDTYKPIATPDALAEAMGWKDETFAWIDGKGFDEAVAELTGESKRK